MTKKYQSMLNNAGLLQHYKKILENEGSELIFFPKGAKDPRPGGWIHCFPKKREGVFLESHFEIRTQGPYGVPTWEKIPMWVAKFLIKKRSLRGGLASPMGRYYGWQAIRSMED